MMRNKRNTALIPPYDSDDSRFDDSEDENDPDFLPHNTTSAPESEEEDSSEEETMEETPKQDCLGHKKKQIIWKTIDKEDSGKTIPVWLDKLPNDREVDTPITYFQELFDDAVIKNIVERSNLYAIQKNPAKPLSVTVEVEQFIGICMYMSIYNLPRTHMYWASTTRIPQIADIMSRNRFQQIKMNLHMNDNNKIDPANLDRLFKIRPLMESLLKNFRAIPMQQFLCVDEQIVPYKGKSGLSQYNPKKPHKWGYKIFVLCDANGLIHNFQMYTGKCDPNPKFPDIGVSSNVVLNMTEFVPHKKNYLVFFDNWFSSPALFVELQKMGIGGLGTIRISRFPGLDFSSDAFMKRLGRGCIEEKQTTIENIDLRAVKWLDNKSVVLVSTFESANPTQEVKRFNKTSKRYISVTCPSIIGTYNKFMGGVDLVDGLISYYRTSIRSKKYYLRFFFHFLDMALVNSWLLYRRDCDANNFKKKDIIDLLTFKSEVAQVMCLCNKNPLKRGRPSSGFIERAFQEKKKRGPTKPIPESEVHRDGIGHFVVVKDDRQRCKRPVCSSLTSFYCIKCHIYLCLNKTRNCFMDLHR